MKKTLFNCCGHKIIILLIIITDLAILLNIPFLRQISGFVFLTLLPGLLILRILRLNNLDFLEKFILAWGISISFLLFFGLLINNLLFAIGYETPLSTISLLISFNIAFIVLAILVHKINIEQIFSLPNFNLSVSEKAFLIVPILFPVMSIFGMNLMNTADNNILLMFLLFLIPIYVIIVCLFNRKFPKRIYPVVLFLTSISLLLMMPLRCNHLMGQDVWLEFFYYTTTLNNLHWSIMEHCTVMDSSLSVSLLPTIYQSILNVPTEHLYKFLNTLLVSVFPVIIYIISKKYIEEGYAFLASMFFITNTSFLWTEYNGRANIAMLFFAFAIMTLFNDRIAPLKKRFLFIVFMASCMVSHYTNGYIFCFILLGTFIGTEILSRKFTFKRAISLTLVVIFSAMIFCWYSQVTGAAFNSGVRFFEETISSFKYFFIAEARSMPAQVLLGKDILQENIIHKVHWVLAWITLAFIGIGVITMISKYKEMSFPEQNFKKPPDFLKDKFEVEYFVLALAMSGLLVAIVAIPHISDHYGLGRSFPLANTILAVFFIIGGIQLGERLNRTFAKRSHFSGNREENGSQVWAYLVILLVLIPYFLSVTGAMYNVADIPRCVTLNSEGEQYDMLYVNDQQLIAEEWSSSSEVFEGRIVNKQKTIGNMTEYLGMFDEKNRIYDNGGSEVWR
jgi:uncharacterized membrane protein